MDGARPIGRVARRARWLHPVDLDGERVLELGWAVRDARTGRGYATELGRAALAWALEHQPDLAVVAFTEVHNRASRAVMERLGMRPAGISDVRDSSRAGPACTRTPLRAVPTLLLNSCRRSRRNERFQNCKLSGPQTLVPLNCRRPQKIHSRAWRSPHSRSRTDAVMRKLDRPVLGSTAGLVAVPLEELFDEVQEGVLCAHAHTSRLAETYGLDAAS
jgi:hypothetical protein